MIRDKSDLHLQYFDRIRKYTTESIEDFLENIPNIKLSKNGSIVTLLGSYAITLSPPIKDPSTIIEQVEIECCNFNEYLPKGLLEQYPYDGKIIKDILTMPGIMGDMPPFNKKIIIFDPQIHYIHQDEDLCLINMQRSPPNCKLNEQGLIKKLNLVLSN